MCVANDRRRDVAVAPAQRLASPGEIEVLVVEEQALVQVTDVVEVRTAEEDGRAAPGEDVFWLVILAVVDLVQSAIRAVPALDEHRAGVVDHPWRAPVENDLGRGGAQARIRFERLDERPEPARLDNRV